MRRLSLAILCALALGATVYADPRRCGDDVDGRGRSVPCDCGDVLVGSRTLGDDDPITSRVCPATGLLVDVPPGRSATLSLAGHALVGSGRGYGIHVAAGGAGGLTIAGPGTVRGFDVGITAPAGQVALLSGVTAADNAADGVRLNGAGYTVTGCEAVGNGRDGFALGGVGYRTSGNRALGNKRYGFQLTGRDAVIGADAGNEAVDNGRDGLRLRGRGHDVAGAVATANGGAGIRARMSQARIADARTDANRGRGLRAAGAELTVSGSTAHDERGGIDVRGARVRDGGGNRAAQCRVGAPCR
jgi:Right handed beta helix region